MILRLSNRVSKSSPKCKVSNNVFKLKKYSDNLCLVATEVGAALFKFYNPCDIPDICENM